MFDSISKWAQKNSFKLIREDRGAKEYVATRKTPKKIFEDKYAFTMEDSIFYENMRVAKTQKYYYHEKEHVNQGKRWGFLLFDILYLLDLFVFGYSNSHFEKGAVLAEGAAKRKRKAKNTSREKN